MTEAVAPVVAPLRTRVYVDGFNLYYGCLKGTPHKWLDLLTLFEQHILPSSAPAASVLLPLSIKFFTAKILEKAAKARDSVSSQARYHSALRKLYDGRIELIEGYYSLNESKARLVDTQVPAKWPRDCVLPRVINGRRPTTKPESWYARPDLLEQVLALAIEVVGTRSKAYKWMEAKNSFLGGQAPIDLVDTDLGAAQVIAYIESYQQQQSNQGD